MNGDTPDCNSFQLATCQDTPLSETSEWRTLGDPESNQLPFRFCHARAIAHGHVFLLDDPDLNPGCAGLDILG